MFLIKYLLIILFIYCVNGQFSGQFWWLNKDLMKQVNETRRDKKAKVENTISEDINEPIRPVINNPNCVCVIENRCAEEYIHSINQERNYCGRSDYRCCIKLKESSTENPYYSKYPSTIDENYLNNLLQQVFVTSTSKPVEVDHKDSKFKCGQQKNATKVDSDSIYFPDSTEETLIETKTFEYPWMLGLYEKQTAAKDYKYRCGAVLISSTVALTSAHCITKNENPEKFIIRAGDYDNHNNNEPLPHEDRDLTKIVRHPEYYSGAFYNDISVLIWRTPFNLSANNIGIICLPEKSETFIAQDCITTGWNKYNPDYDNSFSNPLKLINLSIMNHETCENELQSARSMRRFNLHNSFLCAKGKSDICKGFGGNPLFCKQNNHYVLSGLHSWKMNCNSNVPSVFTKITKYIDWIIAIVNDDNIINQLNLL